MDGSSVFLSPLSIFGGGQRWLDVGGIPGAEAVEKYVKPYEGKLLWLKMSSDLKTVIPQSKKPPTIAAAFAKTTIRKKRPVDEGASCVAEEKTDAVKGEKQVLHSYTPIVKKEEETMQSTDQPTQSGTTDTDQIKRTTPSEGTDTPDQPSEENTKPLSGEKSRSKQIVSFHTTPRQPLPSP